MERCIEECSKLLLKGWIDLEDVESADASLILSIPAVSALVILAESARRGGEPNN